MILWWHFACLTTFECSVNSSIRQFYRSFPAPAPVNSTDDRFLSGTLTIFKLIHLCESVQFAEWPKVRQPDKTTPNIIRIIQNNSGAEMLYHLYCGVYWIILSHSIWCQWILKKKELNIQYQFRFMDANKKKHAHTHTIYDNNNKWSFLWTSPTSSSALSECARLK